MTAASPARWLGYIPKEGNRFTGSDLTTNPSYGPEPGQPWVTLTHSHRSKIHKATRYLEQWASCLVPFTTEEIGTHLLHESGKLVEAMHSVPLARPLQLPDRHLPIDPYLLGLWLGDGSSVAADITCHTDDEPHYRERALAAGENWRIRNFGGPGEIF